MKKLIQIIFSIALFVILLFGSIKAIPANEIIYSKPGTEHICCTRYLASCLMGCKYVYVNDCCILVEGGSLCAQSDC